MRAFTILGISLENNGIELELDSRRATTLSPGNLMDHAGDRTKPSWAYIILAPQYGDFLVWFDAPAERERAVTAQSADDFDSYVNRESGADFRLDTFGNQDPY